MPPIELLDEDEELELVLEGIPNPGEAPEADELESELEDIPNSGEAPEADELESELEDIPNPGEAPEAAAALGEVNAPGRLRLTVGGPPALALDGVPGLALELSAA
jgi:hypothetical protein